MKLTIDPTRAPGPAIMVLSLLNSFSIPPENLLAGGLNVCMGVIGFMLISADTFKLGLRLDRKVIAYLATEPNGVDAQRIGKALNVPARTVSRSLDRLAGDGFVLREAQSEPLPTRTYRLASWPAGQLTS